MSLLWTRCENHANDGDFSDLIVVALKPMACAIDAIVVKGLSLTSTEFFIRFDHSVVSEAAKAQTKLRPDALQKPSGHESFLVEFFVNGSMKRDVFAVVGMDGMVVFWDSLTQTFSRFPNYVTLTTFQLNEGGNLVTCKHLNSLHSVSFEVWLYDVRQQLVVMDIDGTITKSDVRGYVSTVYLGNYSYIHGGLVNFLRALEDIMELKIIYLTARPITHIQQTRAFLHGARDGHIMLSRGPIFPNKGGTLEAAYDEVFAKSTAAFKSAVLSSITEAFKACVHPSPLLRLPFFLGIGNKHTDGLAFHTAGISPDQILIINKQSKIKAWRHINHIEPADDADRKDIGKVPHESKSPPSFAELRALSTSSSSSTSSGRSLSADNAPSPIKSLSITSSRHEPQILNGVFVDEMRKSLAGDNPVHGGKSSPTSSSTKMPNGGDQGDDGNQAPTPTLSAGSVPGPQLHVQGRLVDAEDVSGPIAVPIRSLRQVPDPRDGPQSLSEPPTLTRTQTSRNAIKPKMKLSKAVSSWQPSISAQNSRQPRFSEWLGLKIDQKMNCQADLQVYSGYGDPNLLLYVEESFRRCEEEERIWMRRAAASGSCSGSVASKPIASDLLGMTTGGTVDDEKDVDLATAPDLSLQGRHEIGSDRFDDGGASGVGRTAGPRVVTDVTLLPPPIIASVLGSGTATTAAVSIVSPHHGTAAPKPSSASKWRGWLGI